MKIPVGRTLEEAYGFAFSNFFNIIGIAWFPFLVFILLFVAAVAGLGAVTPDISGIDDAPPSPAAIALMVFLAIAYVATLSMVNVGILRQALGLHKGPVYFYFSLGAPVWRMIGALILAVLGITAIGAAAVAVCAGVIYSVHGVLPAQASMIVFFLMGAVGACIYLYCTVRLLFLLPAAVVALDRIAIGEAWSLARGNFWRIVVIWLATALPVLIGYFVIAVIAGGAGGMTGLPAGGSPRAVLDNADPPVWATIAILLLTLAYFVIRSGVSNAVCAKAYLAVQGTET